MNKKSLSQLPNMQELMDYLNAQTGVISKRNIARDFKIKGDDRKALKKMLKTLKEEGILEKKSDTRKNRLHVVGKLSEYEQIEITGIDSMGDLIARPLDWKTEKEVPQILITKNNINPPAGVGDIVQARLKQLKKLFYEGEIIRRITANKNQMVGIYENNKVYSVDRRLKQSFLLLDVPRSIKNKDILLVEIPLVRSKEPVAKFIQKIGSWEDPFAATILAIYMHKLPVMFLKQTEKDVKNLTVPPLDKFRIDLRNIPFVTIDGADAKDFDDAVWAEPDQDEKNKGGFHIMIAIADVSWYVRCETALDSDAKLRGNSVYFPDRVLPMLPFELSNGVCSLNPNEDRAALVCEVWIDKNGVKKKHQFHRALIKSVCRLTYPEVEEAIKNITPIVGLEKEIESLKNAYGLLKKQRNKRGVIEIDVPEQQVQLDSKGNILSIHPRQMLSSMHLIEELMILANVSAAETLEEKRSPVMYRVHDKPSNEKLEVLNNFLKSLRIIKKPLGESVEPKDFNDILTKTRTKDISFAINEFVLRSQSQAKYSPENIGHFGLALLRYAHFTSPIRRYADLMVHRALVDALKLGEGGLSKEAVDNFEKTAIHISQTERQAASAEQDAVDRYIASYLKNKEQKSFNVRISSITDFGVFVRVEQYGTDGFVPMRYLKGDFYDYDEKAQILMGRSTGKIYKVGDKVKAILTEVSPITGGLLFKLKN